MGKSRRHRSGEMGRKDRQRSNKEAKKGLQNIQLGDPIGMYAAKRLSLLREMLMFHSLYGRYHYAFYF
jgi:hypothetical protein